VTIESKLAPPVVVVLVVDTPGERFDQVLDGVINQNYENYQVLVMNRGHSSNADRVLATIVDATVQQLPNAKTYAEAANVVSDLVEGAAFYLFLRDDTALAPNAVSLLVEEALESNAAVLGPKVVDFNDPSRILYMGFVADAFAVSTPIVEPGELDQEQHDRVREVFSVSGHAVLVRSDLFVTIGGFDQRISDFEEYLDLCWRVQIAGGRILVVPTATVHSLDLISAQDQPRSRRLSMRYRQHIVAKCYGWVHLVPTLIMAMLLSLLELTYSLLALRFQYARDVLWAWGWNLLQTPYVLKERRQISRVRETRDRQIRRRQMTGSSRLRGFLQGQIGGDIALQSIRGRAGRRLTQSFSAGPRRISLIAFSCVGLVLAFGSRHLLTQGVPAYGQFATFPETASLLSEYWSGWREIGVGAAGSGPAALGLLGAVGWLTFGAQELVREILILSLLPIGMLGMWRLLKPLDAIWGRVVGTLLYAVLPVPYNALVDGRWGTLLLVAAVPFVVRRVFGAFGTPKYALGDRSVLAQSAALGLLIAVVAAFEPIVFLIVLAAFLVVAVLTIGLVAARDSFRGVAIVSLSVAIASLMHLPWVGVLGGSDEVLSHLLMRSPSEDFDGLADLLRFAPGFYGSEWAAWCPLLVAVVPLLLGRGERLRMALTAGSVALAGFFLAWCSGNGWLTDLVRRDVMVAEGSMVLAAVGVCWCAALGPSALRLDGARASSVLRQGCVVLGAGSLLVASAVLLLESANGRWGSPTNDLRVSLSLLDDRDIGPSYRVLWLGAPEVLPLSGWPVGEDGLYAATSVRGHPDVRHQWVGAPTGAHQQLLNAVEIGLSGNTVRMGRLLAPFGIRYVAVVERSTPSFSSGTDRPVGPRVRQSLGSQLDLRPLAADPSVRVLLNESWMSSRAQFVGPVRLAGLDEPGELVVTDLTSGVPILTDRRSAREQRGFVGVGEVLVSEAFDNNWRLLVNDTVVSPTRSFGWAMRFNSPVEGPAVLWHIRPDSVADRAVVQIVLWVVIARFAVTERRRVTEVGSPA
tara:strand:- start:6994 stop:10089 length:3096 start_codon:yes stop_codon:yes gene_type:complete